MFGIIVGALSAIAAAAVSVTKGLAVLGLAVQGLKTLGNALLGFARQLGLIKHEHRVDSLGDKALQAEDAGITLERFQSYAEYVAAVENFETDPEKSNLYTDEEKIMKGIELTAGAAIEKFPGMHVENLFRIAGENPEFFTESRLLELGKLGADDPEGLRDVLGFLDSSLREDDALEGAIQALVGIEKTIDPQLSDQEALYNVLNAVEEGE